MSRVVLSLRLERAVVDVLHDIRMRDGVPVNEQIRRAVLHWLEERGEVPASPKPTRKREMHR